MLQELNDLMDYIEKYLTADLSLQQAARELGLSEYHLKRTFSFIAGMSLSEYIRNRKLALANQDLIRGMKVTDVTFKYGYRSVEGFSRAFRDWNGCLPSEIAKNHLQRSFPKLTFQIKVRGGISMNFRIEKKESFHLVGVSKRVALQFEGVNPAIQELAQSITAQQRKEMQEFKDLYPHQLLSASYDFDENRLEEKGELTHLIGFATQRVNHYEDLVDYEVESHQWAIFPNKGPFPQMLQETWGNIYASWLPSSAYELVEAPEISFTENIADNGDVYSEIWIAVKEKE